MDHTHTDLAGGDGQVHLHGCRNCRRAGSAALGVRGTVAEDAPLNAARTYPRCRPG
jgi:hypothetical protein